MNRPTERSTAPSPLIVNGFVELAFGVLTGWVYTATKAAPDTVQSFGLRAPDRIRQWHLELMMQGAFTAVCGLAVPHAPRWIRRSLVVGAWSSPTAFVPLAFKPELETRPAFRAAAALADVATSVGYAGMAAVALRRLCRRRAHPALTI